MHRLIVESSTTQASIALFADAELLIEEICPAGRGPVSRFFSLLAGVVAEVDVIDALVVGVGPGSYSGIRIGISAIIGLQLARGMVARGIHSALGYEGADFQVILDARGSFIYSAVRAGQLVEGPIHCTATDLQEKIDVRLPIFTPDKLPDRGLLQTFPLASVLGKRLAAGNVLADLPLVPLYLKAPHITAAKMRRTLTDGAW